MEENKVTKILGYLVKWDNSAYGSKFTEIQIK